MNKGYLTLMCGVIVGMIITHYVPFSWKGVITIGIVSLIIGYEGKLRETILLIFLLSYFIVIPTQWIMGKEVNWYDLTFFCWFTIALLFYFDDVKNSIFVDKDDITLNLTNE